VVTQSGGAGVLACDRGQELGLNFPPLGDTTLSTLREILPSYAAISNPVDVTGLSLAEPEIMRASMKSVLHDQQIDIGVLWVRLMSGHVDLMVDMLEDIRSSTDKTFVICWVSPPAGALERLRARGFCVTRGAAQAMNALGALVRYVTIRRTFSERHGTSQVINKMLGLQQITVEACVPVPTLDAAEILRRAGIPLIPTELARSSVEAVSIASRLGFPVVLKIESPDITHKTDVGGVRLNLSTAIDVHTAFGEMMQAVGVAAPEARCVGVIIQPMVGRGVELVVGVNFDAIFGHVLMVGIGGIFVEILKDVQFRTVPVTRAVAEEMLSRLRATAMLSGIRGMPSVNKDKLCDLLIAVSEMASSRSGNLISLDLNPVIAMHDEVFAVDWLMIVSREDEDVQKENCVNSTAITKEV
jgi:acetyltransferase